MWSCDNVSFKDIYCCIMHTFMFNKVEGCIQYILCSRLDAKHARSGPCLLQLLCKICLGHESGCSINSLLFFYIDSWSLILMFITYASNYRLQPNRSDWPRWSMTRTMQILRIKWNRYKKLLSFKVKWCFNSSLNANDVHICSQLMEVTGKNQDDCMVALHDCNEDVNRAINFLLEGTSDAVKSHLSDAHVV